MKKEIVITADADGNLTFDAVGYRGVGCVDAVAKVMKAADAGETLAKRHKPDYHKKQSEMRKRTT